MRRRKPFKLAAAATVALLLALGVAALVFADTDIPWRVVGSGGNSASSTSYRLGSTAGQSAIGQSSSTNYRIGAGYWYGAGPPPKQVEPGDTDSDGCSDQRENQPKADAATGGGRNYLYPWDFYDVAGAGGGPRDRYIDLFNDILGVINHWSPGGGPPYDVNFDRGPTAGPNPWNMTAPDGIIDLFNDILGVINQWGHDCRT